MADRLRSWVAVLDGAVLGTFIAPVGKACETMAKRWPTHYASGRVTMRRDPDELARERRQEVPHG